MCPVCFVTTYNLSPMPASRSWSRRASSPCTWWARASPGRRWPCSPPPSPSSSSSPSTHCPTRPRPTCSSVSEDSHSLHKKARVNLELHYAMFEFSSSFRVWQIGLGLDLGHSIAGGQNDIYYFQRTEMMRHCLHVFMFYICLHVPWTLIKVIQESKYGIMNRNVMIIRINRILFFKLNW